jgi:hypothetical protein
MWYGKAEGVMVTTQKISRKMAYRAMERESLNDTELTARADQAILLLVRGEISREELVFWYQREREFRALGG